MKDLNLIENITASVPTLAVKNEIVEIIRQFGNETTIDIANSSDILNKNILATDTSEENNIADKFMMIKDASNKANPKNFDFNQSIFGRISTYLFDGKSPLQTFLSKFETAKDIITSTVSSLEENKIVLRVNNENYLTSQLEFNKVILKLEEEANNLAMISDHVTNIVNSSLDLDYNKYLQETVLFELGKKEQDLVTRKLILQQSIASLDLMIKNNRQHIDTIDRVKNTTIVALQTGAMLTIGLQDQKRAIDLTTIVNDVNNETILANAELMKEQGVQIQSMETNGMVNIEKLSEAIDITISAISDYEYYKKEALPKITKSIKELRSLSDKIDKTIVLENR
jgi:uncharacterized protein YaaN involved in tellurite resistance